MGLEPGTMLGRRYALEELLAQRGDVLEYWSAQDSTLERLVAVTVLPSTGDRAILAHAVLDGARRTAGVDDPRLVRVLDVGEENGYCWIIEEGLPDAESLATLTAEHPLPAEEARRLIGESAVGMESARRRGLHHLYLNPHSLLRTRDGSVKVSGVGVTAAIEQTDDIGAREASLIDTADLVNLLYTGLTGRWPGDEIEGLPAARRLADGSLPAASEVVRGVPGDLDALCRQMLGLDYDPGSGPQTPGDLARQLSPWASEIVTPSSTSHPHRSSFVADGQPMTGAGSAPGGDTGLDNADGPETHGQDAHGQGPLGHDSTGDGPATAAAIGASAAAGAAPYYRADVPEETSERGFLTGPAYAPEDEDGPDLASHYASTPDRGMPPGLRERDGGGRNTALVLGLIGALLAVAAFLAYTAISNLGDDIAPEDTKRPLPTTDAGSTATDEPSETSDSQETTEAPEPGVEVSFVGASDFDSTGGDEKPDLTALAIDGDPSTWWNTFTYLTPNWGGLKDGVGLVVDTGQAQPITEVSVEFPEGDYGATIYVGDSPDTTSTEIATSDDASGTWTVTPEEAVEGRYIVIFFDRAWAGPNGEVVKVAEVSARS